MIDEWIWPAFTTLAIATGVIWGTHYALKRHYPLGHLLGFHATIILSGLAGARLGYVVLWREHYLTNPQQLLDLWSPGLMVQTGVGAGFLGGTIYAHWLGYDRWRATDDAVTFIAVGQAIGRIGCFLAGCCYGVPTSLPWGCRFPTVGNGSVACHPTQLYECIGSFVLCAFLYRLVTRAHRDGSVVAAWLALAGALRFAVELLRGDNFDSFHYGLSVYQWICVGMMLLSMVLWICRPESIRPPLE